MSRFNPLGGLFSRSSPAPSLADRLAFVQARRPRYRSPNTGPAWIDPAWRARHVLESVDPQPKLAGVTTWIYQLQKIDPALIAASEADVAVIDFTPDGDGTPQFARAEVDAMRRKLGGRKKIISYMSIGEAEEWRFYWKRDWMVERGGKKRKSRSCPAWVYDENAAWSSFRVRYWDPEWQKIILGEGDSYLNRIIAAGFDGVYLDIVNGYQEFADKGRKTAATEMIQFVIAIAKAARKQNPDFLIVPQNGEQLLTEPTYRAYISAIGKEDILYNNVGQANDEHTFVTRNPSNESWEVEGFLQHGKRDGIPVLAVEYLHSVKPENLAAIPATADELRRLGYVPYFGNRLLNKVYDPVLPPAPVA